MPHESVGLMGSVNEFIRTITPLVTVATPLMLAVIAYLSRRLNQKVDETKQRASLVADKVETVRTTLEERRAVIDHKLDTIQAVQAKTNGDLAVIKEKVINGH